MIEQIPEAAVPGEDYTVSTGTLNWGPGDISDQVITIGLLNDPSIEWSQTTRIRLTNPAGGAELGQHMLLLTILDDEIVRDNNLDPAGGWVAMNLTQRVVEARGYVDVEVFRHGLNEGPASVDVTGVFGQSSWPDASDGDDVENSVQTVTWGDGEGGIKTVRFPIVDDRDPEVAELFGISLVNAVGTTVLFDGGTIEIVDDDLYHAPGVISMASVLPRVEEGEPFAELTLTRTRGTQGRVSIDVVTAPGDALPGEDFTSTTTTVTWEDNERHSQTFKVPLLGDNTEENIEVFVVVALNPTGGAIVDRSEDPTPDQQFAVVVVYDDGDVTDDVVDSDNDGAVDLADIDDDNDGVRDVKDPFPQDSTESVDADGDGFGDNQDDAFPGDPNEHADADGDNIGDNADPDDDNDNMPDVDEERYGFDPLDPLDAALDFDQDNFSNLEEIQSGTDPKDSSSVPTPGTVEFTTRNSIGTEGGADVTIELHRIFGAAGTVSADWAVVDTQQVKLDEDYVSSAPGVPLTGTVTWGPGDTSVKTITIPLVDDGVVEGTELGRVELTGTTGGARLGLSTAIFMIIGNEVAPDGLPNNGLIGIGSFEQRTSESAGYVDVEILRFLGTEGEVSVDVVVTPGGHFGDTDSIDVGAADGVDYLQPAVTTLTWPAGDSSNKIVRVPIVDDDVPEQTERLLIRLENASGGAFVNFDGSGILIIDDDYQNPAGRIGFAHRTFSMEESEQGVEIILTRDYGSDGEVSVGFGQFTSTADESDFTFNQGTMTWADGDDQPKSFVVAVNDDDVDEGLEWFLPWINNPTGGAELDRRQRWQGEEVNFSLGIVQVWDFTDYDLTTNSDGDLFADIIDLDDDNDGVRDGEDAFPFDPNESADNDGDGVGNNADDLPDDPSEQVDTDSDGIGNNADDDDDGDGIPDDRETDLGLDPLVDDAADDPDADNFSNLEEALSGSDPFDQSSTPSAGVIEFHLAEIFVTEDAGTVELQVQRVLGVGGPAQVTLTTRGSQTALAGIDYVHHSETVSWAAGEGGVKTVTLSIIDDDVAEEADNLYVDLTLPAGQVAQLGQRVAAVRILPDEYQQPTNAFHPGLVGMAGIQRVIESAGVVEVELVRFGGHNGEVSVDVFVASPNHPFFHIQSTEGEDFLQPPSPTVTWANGEDGIKKVRIPILDDNLPEDEENIIIHLQNETGGLQIGWQQFAVTIVDDDVTHPQGQIQFTAHAVMEDESRGFMDFYVTRRFGTSGAVSATVSTVDGRAVVNEDYLAIAPQVLSWADGEDTTYRVRVSLLPDTEPEGDEWFHPVIDNVTGGALLGRRTPNNNSWGLALIFDPANPNPAGDLDGDGVVNGADRDIDGDGRDNLFDAFPYDSSAQDDSDGDGIPDGLDNDADNDGIPNDVEIANNLNPTSNDADSDIDGDGASNIVEYNAGTGINDPNSFPQLVSELVFADAELDQCVNDHGGFVGELQHLDCSWRPINSLAGIRQLFALDSVRLDGLQVDFSEVSQIAGLTRLDVWSSSFDDADLTAFSGHANLAHIGAGNAEVTGASFDVVMPTLPAIQSLHLWGRDDQVYNLQTVIGPLESLALNANQLTNPLDVLLFPTLNQLWLSGVSNADIFALTDLQNGLPSGMRHISFNWSLDIGNDQLQRIASAFPSLRSINIDGTSVTDITPLLTLPLTSLGIHVAPVDPAVVNLLQSAGVDVQGNVAVGEPLPAYLDTINDPTLKLCLENSTNGFVNTGQLRNLHCGGSVIDINSLSAFGNLERLQLDHTPLFYLNGIENLQHLREVYISGTLVRDIGPLTNLPELQHVSLHEIPLNDLDQLNQFSSNHQVNVDGSPDQGELLDNILSDIDQSDASFAQCIRDQRTPDMTHAAHLHSLDCSQHNSYDVRDLTHIDRLIGLSDFGLNTGEQVNYAGLFSLRGLQTIFTSSPAWDDTESGYLAQIPAFRAAWLGGTSITSLEPFRNAINLHTLGLWTGAQLDLSPLYDLPVFDTLMLNPDQVQLDQILNLDLQYLGLSGDLVQSDIDFVAGLTELRGLEFSWSNTVGNVQIAQVTAALPNLTNLGVQGTAVTDLGSIANFNQLIHLNLQWTSVTDYSIAIASQTLESIDINGAPISPADVQALRDNGVQVFGTPGSTDDNDGDGFIDVVDPDDDNDGMSDEKENAWGTNPLINDALDDPDGDNFSNIEEVNSNVNPFDSADTPSEGMVEFNALSYLGAEKSGLIIVTAHRIDGAAGPASVDYTMTPLAGLVSGTDFVGPVSGQFNWGPGDIAVKTVEVQIIDDAIVEGHEYGIFEMSNPSPGLRIGQGRATLSVLEDEITPDPGDVDPVPGELVLAKFARTVSETAGFIDIEVDRTRGSDGEVTVDVVLIPGFGINTDADLNNDLGVPEMTRIGWGNGEFGVRKIRVPIVDDTDQEETESFRINLVNPTGGATIGVAESEVMIIDDDGYNAAGLIGYANRWFQAEESEGNLEVTLTRRHGSSGDVSVDLLVLDPGANPQPGTATPGDDYPATALVPITVSWANGDSTSKTVDISIVNDNLDEVFESFNTILNNPTGGAWLDLQLLDQFGNPTPASIGLGLILDETDRDPQADFDNDGRPDHSDLDDDNDGVRDVYDAFPMDSNESADRDGDGYGDNLADAFPDDPSEHRDNDGDLIGDNADLDDDNDGITDAQELAVGLDPEVDDAAGDPDGDGFSNLEEAVSGSDPFLATSTPTAGVIEFHIAEHFVTEDVGIAKLKLHRVLGIGGQVSVTVTSRDGETAIAGDDYIAVNETVTWLPGESGIKTVDVQILNDSIPEATDNIYFDLHTPTGGAELGQRTGQIRILSDDFSPVNSNEPGYFGMSGNQRVLESEGVVELEIIRFAGSQGEVSVDVSLAGVNPLFDIDAEEGFDYLQPVIATVTWANGEDGVKTVQVPILDDSVDEDEENVSVHLSNPTGGAHVWWTGWSFTIIDDDVVAPEGVVQFVSREMIVDESKGPMVIDVVRRFGSVGPASAVLRLYDSSGVEGQDYTDIDIPISWADGESGVKSFDIPILNDNLYEPTEVIIPRLEDVQGARLGRLNDRGHSEAIGLIFDPGDFDITTDIDNDNILDAADRDIDGDNVSNLFDRFPFDANESSDFDNDGLGDNSDPDGDNDGLPNSFEDPVQGLDSFDPNDALGDLDGDGANNLFEFASNTNVSDPGSFPQRVEELTFTDAELEQCVDDHGGFVAEFTHLDCSWRPISNLAGINQLYALEFVNLNGIQADFTPVAQLSNLDNLQAWSSSISDTDFVAFANHPTLRDLGLGQTQITNTSFGTLGTLPQVRSIHIWGNAFGTPPQVYDLRVLAGKGSITELALNRDQLGDGSNGADGNGLDDVLNLFGLRRLWMNGLSAADIAQLTAPNTGLPIVMEHVSFSYSTEIGNAQLQLIANAFPALTSLEIEATSVTDLGPVFNLFLLEELSLNLSPVDQNQVNQLAASGVNIRGNAATGEPLPAYLDQIHDPELKQCLTNHTQGHINTGQLTWLDCRGTLINDVSSLWPFNNLVHLDLTDTPIRELRNLDSLQKLERIYISNTLVGDIWQITGLQSLYHVSLHEIPLRNLDQLNWFNQNVFIDGQVNQGDDVATIQAVFNASDAELGRCFAEAHVQNPHWQTAADVSWLDCSDYRGYDVQNIAEIDRLPYLDSFYMQNDARQIDYTVLNQLRAVAWLWVSGPSFTDSDLWNISGLPRLHDVFLGQTAITSLEPFRNSVNLHVLHLWNSRQFDLEPLYGLPVFENVGLDATQLVNPNQLLNLPHLTSLSIHGQLSPQDINVVAQLNLTRLSVGFSNTVGNVEVAAVTAGKTLDWFQAAHTPFNDLSAIDNFDDIRELYVARTNVTDFTLAKASPNLQRINIDQTPISQADIDVLVANGVQIEGTPATGVGDFDGDGLIDFLDPDDDNDMMLDMAELAWGYDPMNPADALADDDNDTFSNLEEVNSNTDPRNNQSLPPAGVLEFAVSNAITQEGLATATVTVHRLLGAAGEVRVDYSASSIGNTVAGSDFDLAPGTLVWPAGDISPRTFDITIHDDSDVEPTELGRLHLSNPVGARLGRATAVFTIIDNDYTPDGQPIHGRFGIASFSQRVAENAGYVDVEITRVLGDDGPVSVDVVLLPGGPEHGGDGTDRGASPTADFGMPSISTLHWAHQESGPKTVRIPIVDDGDAEQTERFVIDLRNPTGGAFVDFNSSDVLIVDNDTYNTAGVIGFAHRTFRVEEAENEVTVTLTRNHGANGEVAVNVTQWDNSATALGDFTQTNTQVTWANGDNTPKTVTIPLSNDTTPEEIETFILVLNSPTNGAWIDREQVFQGNALNQSLAFPIIFDYTDTNLNIDSDGDGVKDVADLDDDNDTYRDWDDAFPLDEDEHLDSDGDNVGDNEDVFDNDPTEQYDNDGDNIGDNADVDDDNDGLNDDLEDSVGLNKFVSDIGLDNDNDNFSNIEEALSGSDPNDAGSTPDAGLIGFSDGLVYVTENEGFLHVRLHRLLAVGGAASVDVTFSGANATPGVDFDNTTQTVTWAAGEGGVKMVSVPIINDSDQEPAEGFYLELTNPSAGITLGAQRIYARILTDDLVPDNAQDPGWFGIADGYHVDESAGFVEVSVIRLWGQAGPASVQVHPVMIATGFDVAASDGHDYLWPSDTTVHWGDGEFGVKTIQIPILDDNLDEGKETFNLELMNPQGAEIWWGNAAVHILDNDIDHAAGVIGFTGRGVVVNENQGFIDIQVERRHGDDGVVGVNVGHLSFSAIEGQDYLGTPVPATLQWGDGETGVKLVRFTLVDDESFPPEAVEWFLPVLNNVTGGARLDRDQGGFTMGLGVIFDDSDFAHGNQDVDGDGTLNVADRDADGDGYRGPFDRFGFDPSEWSDVDNDGLGDNIDPDADNDGIPDDVEQ